MGINFSSDLFVDHELITEGRVVGLSPHNFRSYMEKKEIHRLRLSNSVNETSYRKLNNIIDKLKSQRDFYKNELDLIKEEKGENEPMDG